MMISDWNAEIWLRSMKLVEPATDMEKA